MVAKDDSEQPGHGAAGPDPSFLTTAAILREVSMLREIVESMIHGQGEVMTARLDALAGSVKEIKDYPTLLDKATSALSEKFDAKVDGLKELHGALFDSIAKQFLERDIRTSQAAEQSQKAIDAAFSAQKEAGGKTEALFTKLFDQMRDTNAASSKASDDKFTDIKERVGGIENRTKGGQSVWGYITAGLGIVVGLIGIFAFINGLKTEPAAVAPAPIIVQVPAPDVVVTPAAPAPVR